MCHQVLPFRTLSLAKPCVALYHNRIIQDISVSRAHKHLSDAVQLAVGALGLILWPKLQLLLLLLKVNQIPLVLQTRLPPLPELQKQRHCRDVPTSHKLISN